MRRLGGPLCHSIVKAPLASILANALTGRSSVLIWPLPRIPTQWHPAADTTHVARKAIVIFFMNIISLVTMLRGVVSDSGKFQGTAVSSPLSLAIWSTTQRVKELEPTYNYQLTLHELIDRAQREKVFPNLVHLHYHWMLQDRSLANLVFETGGPLSFEQREWLSSAIKPPTSLWNQASRFIQRLR